MTIGARLGGATLFVAAVAATAALVHFTVVLLAPVVASHDAYARLAELGPPGATAALPRAAPGEKRFPWGDPAIAASMCRFDLAGGPVRILAPVGRAGFAAASFHSRRGAVFYALTDRAATKGRIEAVIVTPAQLRALTAHDDEDNPSQDLRVVSPTVDGFVIMRAFSELPSLYSAAADQVNAMTCASEPSPQ